MRLEPRVRLLELLGTISVLDAAVLPFPRAPLHLLDAPRGFYDHFVRDALREWAWQEAPLFRADLTGVHRGVDRVATLALHDGRPALAPQKAAALRGILVGATVTADRLKHLPPAVGDAVPRDGTCLYCRAAADSPRHRYWPLAAADGVSG